MNIHRGIGLIAGLMLAGSMVLSGCSAGSEGAASQQSAPAESAASEETADPTTAAEAEDTAASATSEPGQQDETAASDGTEKETKALAVRMLPGKGIERNPYLADSEANIHNDSYNSDVTDAVLPLGIYPQISTAYEKQNVIAPAALFYDEYGNAISPLLGGIAIRDVDADEVTTLGAYIPAQLGEDFVIQPSYSFVDSENRIVCPTNNNHVIILQTLDENGEVLPQFTKVADIDIMAAAEQALGKQLDQNLLSVTYDYEGNLWFVTGGFRIYPDRQQTGAVGYISNDVITALLNGEPADIAGGTYFLELEPGEGAENGIASSKEGTVILTNLACYLFRADNGVETVWRVPYESVGAKDSPEGAATTGGGLAWGGGASPSLTNDLVCFTDNQDPVNLIAVDMKTGEIAASMPVIDDLPEDTPVSVENSIIVYGGEPDTTSVIICNWFGAGNAGLAAADSDSSVQTYDNIYDQNWINEGNIMLAPGMERVDIVKTADGYEMESVWTRDDIRDTSMFKLSTAAGYLYGYVQDLETGMWQYIVLDFDTGETLLTVDVSDEPGYNNMAIGMFNGVNGNALYAPTGFMELLRLQDRFVYLPDSPYRAVDIDKTTRVRLADDALAGDAAGRKPVSYLHSAEIENVHPTTTIAFRMTGLAGSPDDLVLYAQNADGQLVEVSSDLWSLEGADGTLNEDEIYEVFFTVEDGGTYDLNPEEKTVKAAVALAQ
ncbi:MAG: hypothetical protein HDQ87_01080 [Clostridia bacterium]|nr:hypothetical protein [Clostridia bacterium]